MKELSTRLAVSAKNNGICDQWFGLLSDCNDDQIGRMLTMYRKGIDFCMKNNWPDLDTIRRFFKGKMEDRGIHVDETCSIKNDPFVVLLGRSNAEITADNYSAGEMYIRHETKAKIIVSDHAFLYIDVYDDAKIEIIASDHAKVCVKNHGSADIKIEKTGDSVVKLK